MRTLFHLVAFLAVFAVLVGCAQPNRYAMEEGNGGYSEEKISDTIFVARFAGNSNTPSQNADTLSHFRAVEVCLERGNLLARFWGTTDRSLSKTVRHSAHASYVSPTYLNGQNSNHTGVLGNANGAAKFGNDSFWNQTFEYPTFDTAFSCSTRAYSLGAAFIQVPREEMKKLANDFPEGVRVDSFNIGSQTQAALRVGDIVLKLNGVRMRTVAQLGIALDNSPQKDRLELSLLRNGQPLVVTVKALEITTEARALNRVIINQACDLAQSRHRPLCSYFAPK
jgi:hypothetical protein